MCFYSEKKSLSKKQTRFYDLKRVAIYATTGDVAFSVDEALKLALLSPKS